MNGFKKTWRGVLAAMTLGLSATSVADDVVGWPEKADLKFGFIKLTDMAPLAIAYEKGYFEEEGLFVTLEAQANWKVLLDRVIDGHDIWPLIAGQREAKSPHRMYYYYRGRSLESARRGKWKLRRAGKKKGGDAARGSGARLALAGGCPLLFDV